MNETRQSQFRRARAAADGRIGLENDYGEAGSRHRNRRRQPVWAGADDYRVRFLSHPSLL